MPKRGNRARSGASPERIPESRGTSRIRRTRGARAARSHPHPVGIPPRSLERALETRVAGTRLGRAGLRRGRSEGARDEGARDAHGRSAPFARDDIHGRIRPDRSLSQVSNATLGVVSRRMSAKVSLTSVSLTPRRMTERTWLHDESQSGHPPTRGREIIHGMTVFHWCCPSGNRGTRTTKECVSSFIFFNRLKVQVIRERARSAISPIFCRGHQYSRFRGLGASHTASSGRVGPMDIRTACGTEWARAASWRAAR